MSRSPNEQPRNTPRSLREKSNSGEKRTLLRHAGSPIAGRQSRGRLDFHASAIRGAARASGGLQPATPPAIRQRPARRWAGCCPAETVKFSASATGSPLPARRVGLSAPIANISLPRSPSTNKFRGLQPFNSAGARHEKVATLDLSLVRFFVRFSFLSPFCLPLSVEPGARAYHLNRSHAYTR